ncbi:alpha/beta hydrolase [Pseudooceanicola algae]|nr:alpha/beta hydrolase [Pseudooceanicola algae]
MTGIDLASEGGWPADRLDADYQPRGTISEARFAAEMASYRSTSEAMRAPFGRHFDLVYDRQSGQTLDLFGPEVLRDCPVFVFIHGGYWRALSKRDSAMMAGMLAGQGIATAVLDYQLAPGASLTEITRQVRAAVGFLWREGRGLGLDPQRIHVGGSSAGGHLAGAVLAGGWQAEAGLPEGVIASALPISGLFDLTPIAASAPQAWLSLSADDVAALSPIRNLPRRGAPITLAWAETDPAGFKRQSVAYAAAWAQAGFPARCLEVPGRNHFDILAELGDASTVLSRALIAQIGA